jgi:hypothetical protein
MRKSCVQLVHGLRTSVWKTPRLSPFLPGFAHTNYAKSTGLGRFPDIIPMLLPQLYTHVFALFNRYSVNFSTISTGPITTTTMYIKNNRKGA